MLWIIISLIVVIVDQVSKQMIIGNMNYGQAVPVIDRFFYITYHANKGAAWSILQNGRIFFLIITPIIAAIIIRFIFKSENKFLKLSLSLILGGAAGNYVDRLLKGSVIDFLQFNFGSYSFPIFNAADSFVVIGTILLAVYMLFIYKEPDKKGIE